MSDRSSGFGRFRNLHPSRAGDRQKAELRQLSPEMTLLRQWQLERLTATHNDLLHSERFGPACAFFLSDLYAPRDFSQRDQDGEHVYEIMRTFLPDRMLQTVGLALELNRLTRSLDDDLLTVLVDQLGMTDQLSAELYAEAYRLCDNYGLRKQQIDMLMEVGLGVNKLARRPFAEQVLRLAHGPAYRAGWGELQDFLERGFVAFKQMKDARPFLDIVCGREHVILDQIYANRPNPFTIT